MTEQIRIRNNGTIHEIKIPTDAMEVMQRIAKSNVAEPVKDNVIKKLSGGICCICRGIPSHEVIYDVESATKD